MKKINTSNSNRGIISIDDPLKKKHYQEKRKIIFFRLALTYLLPTLIMIAYFANEYYSMVKDSTEKRLISIAESQAKILDIFMMERTRNLLNKIDNPNFIENMNDEILERILYELKTDSRAFIDVGYFENSGVQKFYSGPESSLAMKDYSNEKWFIELTKSDRRNIITDIYMGLRNKPHFTIAVIRNIDSNNFILLKSSLDPQTIYESVTSFEQSQDVDIYIVNNAGLYQLVKTEDEELSAKSPFNPDTKKIKGIKQAIISDEERTYAYSHLAGTDWAVIALEKESDTAFVAIQYSVIIPSTLLIIILVIILFNRSKSMVIAEYDKDIVKAQLQQASKLAAIGELASGIAHEIGNPLNIIANEVGIMQDFANPRFQSDKSIKDLKTNFDKIMKSVFRIKDINRKMLSFVRAGETNLNKSDINESITDLTSGFLEHELSLRNIKLTIDFDQDKLLGMIDENQFRQVMINLLNNAADAISGHGNIYIKTRIKTNGVHISVSDTGTGIKPEQIEKIFLPFFTTKPTGKGTGLGLSVSYNIIKSFGGDISVESIPGIGTNFTIILPKV
jgi:two-component system, NtrC family, sensor kinase